MDINALAISKLQDKIFKLEQALEIAEEALTACRNWAGDIEYHNVMERNCMDFDELVKKGCKEIVAIVDWARKPISKLKQLRGEK